jgi:hypothetical protein
VLEAVLVKCPDHVVALSNVGYLHAVLGNLHKVPAAWSPGAGRPRQL